MRTCVSRASGATTFVRRCIERRRQTARRPSAGPSAAARAGGPRRGRAPARRWSARARRRGRARLHDPPRRLHDPSPRAAPASSSADGGWLCLLAKLGNGGQPRRALLRRGRGPTGESLAQRFVHGSAPRAAFGRANTTCVRCDVPSARRVRLVLGRKRSVRQGVGVPFSVCVVAFHSVRVLQKAQKWAHAAPKLSFVALGYGKYV